VPRVAQNNARVHHREDAHGQNDHGAFEDHEGDFLVGQFPVEAFLQFGYAEGGSHEDEDRRREESCRDGAGQEVNTSRAAGTRETAYRARMP
jgi:hypothetical protein